MADKESAFVLRNMPANIGHDHMDSDGFFNRHQYEMITCFTDKANVVILGLALPLLA